MTALYDWYLETFGEELTMFMLTVWGISLAFMLVAGIVRYVLKGVSLYTICKRRGLKARGLSWVPYGSTWIAGSIADHYDRVTKGRDRNYRTWLLIGDIVITALLVVVMANYMSAMIDMFKAAEMAENTVEWMKSFALLWAMMIPMFALQVFAYIVQYKIYASCSPKASGWLLALGIIFNFGGLESAIPLFCLRKKDNGLVPQDPEEAERERKRLELYN